MKPLLRSLAGAIALPLVSLPLSGAISPAALEALQQVRLDAAEVVTDHYFAPARIDEGFRARMAQLGSQLESARGTTDGCLAIADAFLAFDPGIRLYLFPRQERFDYGWKWRLVGDAAFVTHVDSDGDAARQGLRVGDQVVSIEGKPINRGTFRLLNYVLQSVAPRRRLVVVVRPETGDDRTLTIESTIRPERRVQSPQRFEGGGYDVVLNEAETARLAEFRDPARHVQWVADVLVWRAEELNRRIQDTQAQLRHLEGAAGLVIDLRGLYVFRSDTVMAVLNAVMAAKTPIARIEYRRERRTLETSGRGSFTGGIIVLVDSGTAGYAELLAHSLQFHNRSLVIGDRTLGQVREEAVAFVQRVHIPAESKTTVVRVQGSSGQLVPEVVQEVTQATTDVRLKLARISDEVFDPSRRFHGIRFPIGRVIAAGEQDLHGTGVVPKVTLLPRALDLARKSDPVLATALAYFGKQVRPEDAHRLFRNDEDDDEVILDRLALL